jgi:hypothetical protein
MRYIIQYKLLLGYRSVIKIKKLSKNKAKPIQIRSFLSTYIHASCNHQLHKLHCKRVASFFTFLRSVIPKIFKAIFSVYFEVLFFIIEIKGKSVINKLACYYSQRKYIILPRKRVAIDWVIALGSPIGHSKSWYELVIADRMVI